MVSFRTEVNHKEEVGGGSYTPNLHFLSKLKFLVACKVLTPAKYREINKLLTFFNIITDGFIWKLQSSVQLYHLPEH